MPYELNADLSTPPDDKVLWRYLSLVKYMYLLERKMLWFARAVTFEDPLEGTYTDAEVSYLNSLPSTPSPSGPFPVGQTYLRNVDMMRQTTHVNCWRGGKTESMAMWDAYGKSEGIVAVKSNVGLLKQALLPYAGRVFIAEVKYVDWSEIAWNANVLAMCSRKDISYQHEAEVRAIIWDLANAGLVPVSSSAQYTAGGTKYTGPPGLEIPCDPANLITEVVVGPREQSMVRDLVDAVTKRYAYTFPVSSSTRLKKR